MSQVKEAVVLIPGFLGFKQIGEFSYFEDRVATSLSAALAMHRGHLVPVYPLDTLPTEGLARRQQHLMTGLQAVLQHHPALEQLHLVGHSTGGVDALLLTRSTPLGDRKASWNKEDNEIRDRLGTVVTLGSPHHGTCLASSPLASLFHDFPWTPADLRCSAGAVWDLLRSFTGKVDTMATDAVSAAFSDVCGAGRYVAEVLSARDLIRELQPEHLVPIQERFETDLKQARVRTIVTMAGHETSDYRGAGAPRVPDPFFATIYGHTAGDGHCDQRPIAAAAARLDRLIQHKAVPVIVNDRTRLRRPITPEVNDGIVNTARQMLDEDPWAVVVADHIDVLGYYPRYGSTGNQVQCGILHSGSGFSDDQFVELYVQVARAIV